MDRIDLHTHSNKSDGSLSPAELVRHAAGQGLLAIALTDHDTTEGMIITASILSGVWSILSTGGRSAIRKCAAG